MEILYATEDIQDNGGMLTSVRLPLSFRQVMNICVLIVFFLKEGNRTRTPGGVYIQLIRKDDTILNCQRKQIFIEDAIKKKKQKAVKRLAQARRFNQAKQELMRKEKRSGATEGDEGKHKATTQDDEEDLLDGIEEDGMIYFDD